MRRALVGSLVAAALLAAACGGPAPSFTQSRTLGGKVISPARLNRGARAYVPYCAACHGLKGDGKGSAASGLRPPPRDFTQGIFKFASVPAGELPTDADLARVVKKGLHGTAMLAWSDIPDGDVAAITDYIKTFSPRWEDQEAGTPIVPSPDPWTETRKSDAIARGRLVYHGFARCLACHPSYARAEEVNAASLELLKRPATPREDPFAAVRTRSEMGFDVMPPDFLRDPLRAGESLPELYVTIAAGIGGTAMPAWKDSMSEPDLWALAHYVRSLVEIRATEEAMRMRNALTAPAHPQPGAAGAAVTR